MTVRMPPATIPVRPSRPDLPAPKPSAFPVLTCELTIPAGATRPRLAVRRLPLPKADAQTHRGARRHRLPRQVERQDLPELRRRRAMAVPARRQRGRRDGARPRHSRRRLSLSRERVRRRATPGAPAAPWGYGWDAWDADFFQPARSLLAAAPWIVVRGNHESCNRAGQGWWRFLDPRPLAPRQDCNAAADDDIGDYSDAVRGSARPRHRHAVHRVRFVERRRDAAAPRRVPCTAPTRAQIEYAFALAAQRRRRSS